VNMIIVCYNLFSWRESCFTIDNKNNDVDRSDSFSWSEMYPQDNLLMTI